MSDIRWNPISGKWSLIATERRSRPKDHHLEPATPSNIHPDCPFCPGHEEQTPPEIEAFPHSGPGWQIRVVPNKYPAIPPDPLSNEKGLRLYQSKSGGGQHEVIIDSPDHLKGLADLPGSHAADVLRTLQRRVAAIFAKESIKAVTPFKNHGTVAGASLEHSHFQVLGLPVIPSHLALEKKHAEMHFHNTGRPLLDDVIEWELGQKHRIVEHQGDGAVVYTPFASCFPFQTEISPWPSGVSFVESSSDIIAATGNALARTLRKLKISLDDPPLNVFVHLESKEDYQKENAAYRWRIEIIPRLTVLAGLEIGAGMHINEVAPEEAAKCLRETITS